MVVYSNRLMIERAVVILPIVGLCYFLIFLLFGRIIHNTWIYLVFSLLFWPIIFVFFIGSIMAIYYLRSNPPILVINDQGLWIKNFGLIKWIDLVAIEKCKSRFYPIETLKISVRNMDELKQSASFAGKCAVFWSKIFCTPPIILSDLDVPYDVIINQVEKFLDRGR